MARKFVTSVFEDMLIAQGAELAYSISEYGQGLAMDADYQYRYGLDDVQIGLRKHFDRWANSVDFVCRVPRDELSLLSMQAALKDCVEKKRVTEGWGGSVDLAPYVRKARKTLKFQMRCAAAASNDDLVQQAA